MSIAPNVVEHLEPRLLPARRHRRGHLVSLSHDGVLSRRELREYGWDRNAVAREVAAGRWRLHGRRTVGLHTAPLGLEARCWRAVFEVGETIATIDGVTALQMAGLHSFTEDAIHVSVHHLAKIRPVSGVVIHKVRHRVDGESTSSGLPRTRPAVAAIRAAHWAVSDRQAALILLMGGQQRLYRASDLAEMRTHVRGRTRRKLIDRLIRAVTDGVQALGELDVATMCRRRGLPPPTHQVIRRGPRGRIYLDLGWEDVGLFVEHVVDAVSQHADLHLLQGHGVQDTVATGLQEEGAAAGRPHGPGDEALRWVEDGGGHGHHPRSRTRRAARGGVEP